MQLASLSRCSSVPLMHPRHAHFSTSKAGSLLTTDTMSHLWLQEHPTPEDGATKDPPGTIKDSEATVTEEAPTAGVDAGPLGAAGSDPAGAVAEVGAGCHSVSFASAPSAAFLAARLMFCVAPMVVLCPFICSSL
jgi:hypothetical protein